MPMTLARTVVITLVVYSFASCRSQAVAGAVPASSNSPAQEALRKGAPEAAKPSTSLHLTPLEEIVSSEVARGFLGPFVCDGNENLYLRSDSAGVTAIRKLNAKGELVALYAPSTNPDMHVAFTRYFTTTADGELYALVYAKDELARYVLVYDDEGTYKSKIKLDTSIKWMPGAMAVFPNGSLLITGQEYDRDLKGPKLPFTGIFRSDGKLLKELDLDDDQSIQDMAAANDARVTIPRAPTNNRAVSLSQVEAAKDGNLYLMRWLSPAVFYAISPGGQVVRRFAVDAGNPDYKPVEMHISGNRIAVLFVEPQTMEKIMKIVDLEGHELATYDELRVDGKPKMGMLGAAFACYTQQPERFTFLVMDEKNRIELKRAGAR